MDNPRKKNKTSQLQANLFEENITTISLSLKKMASASSLTNFTLYNVLK